MRLLNDDLLKHTPADKPHNPGVLKIYKYSKSNLLDNRFVYSGLAGFCRMLLGRNTPGRWAVRLVGVLLAAAWAGSAAGQADARAPALAATDGESAFDWVQDWVRADAGVPGRDALPDRPVTGVFGVYVTLRDEGRVMGRGQALREDVDATVDRPGPPVQLAELLAAATVQALDQMRDKMMQRAVEIGLNDPDLFKQGYLAARQRVQVDVQIGHNLESIVLPIDGEDAAVFATFAPGFHGLRMAGNIAAAPDYAWPATELSRNTTPIRLILRLLDEQGYDPDDLPLVARADGPSLQRFEVLHLVRPRPAQPMRMLTRGNMVLQQQVIDQRTIDGLAERVARYLDRLIDQQPGGRWTVRGTYQPSMERYAPQRAEPRQAALVCYALMRHARIKLDAEDGGKAITGRAQRVLELVEQLESSALPEPGKPKHLTAAFLLMALCESPINLDPPLIALRDRLGNALIEMRHPDGGGFRVMADEDRRLPRASAAVVTAALAAWYEQTRKRERVGPIWAVLDDLMAVNADDARVVDLVWVSIALSKAGTLLAEHHPQTDQATQQLAAWKSTMAEQAALLGEQQVRGNPVLGPNDVIGGFLLTPAPPGSPPNPTWQSTMPLTIIAVSLRDPTIVPPQRNFGPLLTAGLGARFIGQLILTESSAFYMRDVRPALGGVRNTLWDNTLYPDCSSMALLALAELEQTLQQLEPAD